MPKVTTGPASGPDAGHADRVEEALTLAELLAVDTPVVTRTIPRLERQELVVRQNDPDDRRATRIRLTAPGNRSAGEHERGPENARD